MWPFKRREADDTPAAPPVHRAGPGDWRHLAPIATVQTASLTTIDGRFEDHLATRQSPQFLRPLGHHLVPDGPSGRVAAAVVPGTRREFAPVATQRQVASLAPADPAPTGPTIEAPPDGPDDVIAGPSASSAVNLPVDAPMVGETTIVAPAPASPVGAPVVARVVDRPSLVRAPEPPSRPATPVLTVPTVRRLAEDAAPDTVVTDALSSESSTADLPPVDEPAASAADTADTDVPTAAPLEVGLVGGEPSTSPTSIPADDPVEPTSISYVGAPRAVAPNAERGPAVTSTPITPAIATPLQRSPQPAPSSPVPTSPVAAREVAVDEPITTAPLDRPLRTVIGPPIVKVPTVARELATSSPSPSPSVPAPAPGDAGVPPARSEAAVQRTPAGAVPPPAAVRRDVAPSAPELRPTIGSDVSPSTAVPAPATAGVPDLTATAVDGLTGPADQATRREPAWPTDVTAPTVTELGSDVAGTADGAPVDTLPTLTSEWLPAVARQTLDRPGPAQPSTAPRPGPASGRPVQRDLAVGRPPVSGADDTVTGSGWPDVVTSGAPTFETTIATLGSGPGLSAPPAAARPTTAPRTVIGEPISRAALQRTPLSGSMSTTSTGTPTPTPATSFAPSPADWASGGDRSDAAEPTTEWPIVQFELAGASAPTGAGGSPPDTTVMRAEATSGPAAAAPAASGPGGRTDAEVDELLRAMYPQLRRQLCRDLLLDRERAGYGTDIRF